MKTNVESRHHIEPNDGRYPRLIVSPVTTRLRAVLVAVGLLLAIPCARAQTELSSADKDFILAAIQGGMTEVTLGDLAARQGTRDDVRVFGQAMVTDHAAINADLKALAAHKGVTLPDRLDENHQATVEKMAALLGSEFDEAYISIMIKDHKMDVKEFKAQSAETNDEDIKRFVDKWIPVVAEHLRRIAAIKS